MNISLVIPAYNEQDYIGKTLQSVLSNRPDNLLEIIVVNNASTDKTAEIASSFSGITVVTELQKGLTKARQAGLNAAHGDLVAYIDADTLVSKKWFEILNKEFSNNEKLVCLSGPYFYYDIPKWQQWLVKSYWNLIAKPMYNVTEFMAVGGNFVARRDALVTIGGFDSTIAFYGEDTDIARRLHQVGEVKFTYDFWIATSGRRFAKEGLLRTGAKYMLNFGSVAFFKKPISEKYKDVR